MLLGTVIYVLLQVVFIGALPASNLGKGWADLANQNGLINGPLAFIAGASGLAWLATILRIDAFISPSGTGLIYVTSGSRVGYGLGRNRYFPQVFTKVDKRGIPWISLLLAFAVRPGVPAAVPELECPRGPGHLGQRADVRGSTIVARCAAQPGT